MLEGLDKIDWSQYWNTYAPDGSAADSQIPGLIRELTSEKASIRQEAMRMLFGIICHQGAVFDSTALAIPFLIELLTYEQVQDKDQILYLLYSVHCSEADLQSGYYSHVYRSINAELEKGIGVYSTLVFSENERERELALKLLLV